MAGIGAEATIMMTLRLPVVLREALEKEADTRNLSMNDVVRKALEEYLKDKQRP